MCKFILKLTTKEAEKFLKLNLFINNSGKDNDVEYIKEELKQWEQ